MFSYLNRTCDKHTDRQTDTWPKRLPR